MNARRAVGTTALVLALTGCGPHEPTSRDLWQAYAADPDRHPNIPNDSFAGYQQGERPLPAMGVVASVRDLGARGDGQADDGPAFRAALDHAAARGGGAVLVPEGRYRIGGPLRLTADGVVLRGARRETSVLEFSMPLQDVLGSLRFRGNSQWSWSGGQIWIGPADTFDAEGRVRGGETDRVNAWENWRPGAVLARAVSEAAAGSREMEVDDSSTLRAGQLVLLSWANTADRSLLLGMAGHVKMGSYPWGDAGWLQPAATERWRWPVRLAQVEGRRVRLAQPLRLPVASHWDVRLEDPGAVVRSAGVEHLTLRLHAPPEHRHLAGAGHNGVYLNRTLDAFVRDVEIVDAENGIVVAASKNATVTGVRLSGTAQQHHSLACRVGSHDVLFEDFVVDGPTRVRHGINVEFLSSGNVWRRGRMKRGTFDSHRGLSFDLLRTDIELRNEEGAYPGGARDAGPHLGRRVVHWNVRVGPSDRDDPGAYVNQPNALPTGALVGVQGVPLGHSPLAGGVPGRKGCLVVDVDHRPDPADLYQAQLNLRLAREGPALPSTNPPR